MKIIYKTDNIITAPELFIIHGCNCQGVMGSGVALAIRNRFPKAYKEYLKWAEKKPMPLGFLQVIPCTDKLGTKYIGNALTQEYYGRIPGEQYCNYIAIRNCLEETKNYCLDLQTLSFAMPKIGCGLGGGDWKIVEEIVNTVFLDTLITPVVYDNQKIATQ